MAHEGPPVLGDQGKEVQKARIDLQIMLMGVKGEANWTLEDGRAFSLLFPPHTSPGEGKFKVLEIFNQIKSANEARRTELLHGLLVEMEKAGLNSRIAKHEARRSMRGSGQSTADVQ